MSSAGPDPSVRAAKARRWAVVLAALVAALVAGRVGWTYIADGMRRWLDQAHSSHGWSWRLWGARRDGLVLSADSVRLDGPPIRLRLRRIRIALSLKGTDHPIPGSVEVFAGRADLSPVPSAVPDTSAPAFPDIQIPLEAAVSVDSLFVRAKSPDSGRLIVSIRRVRAATEGPRAVRARAQAVEFPGVAATLEAEVRADWTESDTLRARATVVASSGCCASDTVRAQVAASRKDLRRGRASASGAIEESRGWTEVVPALAKAPALHGIRADVSVRSDPSGPSGTIHLSLSTDSVAVLPPMDWDATIGLEGRDAKVAVAGSLPSSRAPNLDLRISALLPRSLSPLGARASGTLDVQGIGMQIAGFDHPFDSHASIVSLDRHGAQVALATRAGSAIAGQAVWNGLHWQLEGRISPTEPWALAWVDSLRLEDGARVVGHDSAGLGAFEVVALRPRFRMVRLDSLSAGVRLSLQGPRVEFHRIAASDSALSWTGSGLVSIPDSLVEFRLSPAWDPNGNAALRVKIGGAVDIEANDFPSRGLPLDLPFLPAFPVRADARFHRDPASGNQAPISQVHASLRGLPAKDSLHVVLDLGIGDSVLRLGGLRASVGGSSIDAGLVLGRSPAGWLLDTLRGSTTGFDLADLQGLVPGMPPLRGTMSGRFLSQRGQGVSADLKLGSPAVSKPDGDILLPDLLLWGERDTLHLGGWWPVGGTRAPFRITATRLWEPTPEFDLVAFWGDVLKLRAQGRFEDRKHLRTSLVSVEGAASIPGSQVRIRDLLVDGRFSGDLGPSGFSWRAFADGRRGVLQAVAGNPLSLRFSARADKDSLHLLSADLAAPSGGTLRLRGGYDLARKLYWADGLGRSMRFDLGDDRRAEFDSLRLSALPDSRILLDLQGASWHQGWNRDEFVDLRVPRASLSLSQAKDWRKLTGDISVDRLLFTRNFAEPSALLGAARQAAGGHRRASEQSSASSTLLDVRVASMGDSIQLRDNLGSARLSFDLQVSGPADAPLLNGFLAADTEGGHFGYLKRDFHIDTLRVDWNTQSIPEGRFQLAGFRNIRRSCQEQGSAAALTSSDSCKLAISAQGTLEQPRLRTPTSDCANQTGDDGTIGATVALATGCYPQQLGSGNSRMGSAIQSAGTDFLVDQGKDWVNEFVARRLRRSRTDLVWLPDSVALTDIPTTSQSRDQLGLMALYHITPEMDAAGIYQHTFAQSATAVGSKPVLSDNYGLSLQYRIPFRWIEEPAVRLRLENRVFLQCDVGEALDDNLRRATVVQPSLRYHWEFW